MSDDLITVPPSPAPPLAALRARLDALMADPGVWLKVAVSRELTADVYVRVPTNRAEDGLSQDEVDKAAANLDEIDWEDSGYSRAGRREIVDVPEVEDFDAREDEIVRLAAVLRALESAELEARRAQT